MTAFLLVSRVEGLHTFRYRQSSLMFVFGFHMSTYLLSYESSTNWKHAFGKRVASIVPLDLFRCTGGWKRNDPMGGSANGMLTKASTWAPSGIEYLRPLMRPTLGTSTETEPDTAAETLLFKQ